MYGYASGMVSGGQMISTSSNSTQTKSSGYSISTDNVQMTGNSGQSLTSMGHSLQSTLWTGIGSTLSLSGICGQGGSQVSQSHYSATGSWSQNDLNWNGGLAQSNSVSGTILSSGNQSSIQQYSTAGSLTGSGWSVSGFGSIRNSKTDSSSMESSQGNYSQTSADPNNTQTSSGSSSASSSSSSTSGSTVYMTLVSGGNWVASSGTSDESQTSSSNSRSDWSGIYGSEEYAGITSGFSRQEQSSNKSVHMTLVNGEWEISGGTGRESGLTESESIYNSGRDTDDPTQADSSYSHSHQETGSIGSGMGIAFANTTSTEYRHKYDKSDYTCTTSWGGSDWSIVGTGSIASQTTVFSESSASDGTFNGPNGITGSDASKYSRFYSDEGSSIITAYNPVTEEWYTVSGSANSSQETTSRLSYSGSGSDSIVSGDINDFFGDSTSQGSGMSRTSSMSYFSEDNSSSNSTFSLVGDEWQTDTGSSYSYDGQYRNTSDSSYEGSFGTEESGVTWEQSGSNNSDSGSSWSVEGTWSGTNWTETGNRIVRNKNESNESKSNSKSITGTMESAGAAWNSTSSNSFSSTIRQSTNEFFSESLGADGEWGLSAGSGSQLTIHGPSMDDPDNPTSSGTRSSESYSLITSSSEASGTVVGGTYGSVCILSGSSSGTSSTRSEKSSSITEEVEEGLDGCNWTVSGTSGDSYSSSHTQNSSYSSVPVGSTGHSTTTYSQNDESSYSISMEINDYDTGWVYSEGNSDSSYSETTTVDTVLEVNMWSNVLSGKNVNWTSKSGELSTETLQYSTSMTLGGSDMSNPTWGVNSESEGANSGSWSITSAVYDEVSSSMSWEGGTATGTDGTEYNITSQSFSEKIRNETGTSGITVSYTFDGEDWNSSGSTGSIKGAEIKEYASSIAGTFAGGGFSRSSHNNTRSDYELVVGSNGNQYSSGTGTYTEDSGSSYSNDISGTMSGGTWSRSSSGSNSTDISAAFTAILDQGNWTGWFTESGTANISSESSEEASASASHDLTTNDYYVYMDDSVQITDFTEEYEYDYSKEYDSSHNYSWAPGNINDPNNQGDWSLSSGTVSNDETTTESSYLNVIGTGAYGIGNTVLSGTVNWQTGSDSLDTQNWTKTYANGAWSAGNGSLGSGFRENYTLYSYSVSGDYTSGSSTGSFLLDTSYEYNSGDSWTYIVATPCQAGADDIVKSPSHTYTTSIYDYDYEYSLFSTYDTGGSKNITKYSRHTVDCIEYEPDGSGNMVLVSPDTEVIGSGSYYSYNLTYYSRPYTRYIEENFTVTGTEAGSVETEQDVTFNIYKSAENYRYYEVGTCVYSYLYTSGWDGSANKNVSSTTGSEGNPNTNYSYYTHTNTAGLSENTAYEYGYVTTTHFGYGLTAIEAEGWTEGTSGFSYSFSNSSRSANGSSESNSGSYYDESMECTYSSEYNKYDTSTNVNRSNGHISADYSCSINWTYTSTPSPDGNKESYTFSEHYTGAGDRDNNSYSKSTGHEYIYSYFSVSGGGTSYSEVNTRTTDTWTEQSSNTNDSFEYDYSWSWSYSTDGGFTRSAPVFDNATEGESTSSYQYYNLILYYNTYSGSSTELSNSPATLSSDNFNEIVHYGGFNNRCGNYLDPEIARYTPFETMWSEHIYYSYYFYQETGEEEQFSFNVQGVFWVNGDILYGNYMPGGPSLGVDYYQPGMPSSDETGMPQVDSLLISFQENPTAPVIQVEVDVLAIIGTGINYYIDSCVQAGEQLVDIAVEAADACLAFGEFIANTAITVAVGIYDATIGSAVNNWMTVYNNMQETGNGFWASVYAATGTILAETTGILSIDNAIQGEDLYTGRQLSGTERFLEGASGGFQLISTAFGGLNMVRSTIRATGGCKTALGKMFTNCCFTENVEVLMYREPITVSNEAVCVDKAEVHYFTDKNNYLPYIVTLAAGTLGANAYIAGRKRRNRNAIAACYEMFGTEEENNFADMNDTENEQFLRSLAESQRSEIQMPQITAGEESLGCDDFSELPEAVLENKLSESKKNPPRKEEINWHAMILQYGGLLTILFSIFMLISLIQRESGSNANSSLPQAQAAVAPVVTPEPFKPEICRKKISEIHIGEKSVGHNPQGIEASESDSEIFQKVKHNGYTLLYFKENQTLSVIELLRPENWLESENIQIRRGSDDKVLEDSELEQFDLAKEFNRDDEDYDLEVWIELPEMGVVGWTTLVAIDDQVKIQDGPGNVVTGTFAHISDNVIDLQLEGQDKPIGCTGNHPFWSADRQEFIEAGQLLEGEQVLLYSGETKRVAQKLPRPGPQVVYNLEVYAEHVYHVTQDGVLVHNTCNSKILARNMKRAGIYNPKMGKVRFAAHHIVCAKDTPDAAKILQQYNIGINSFWNGVYLPMKKNTSFGTAHIGRHAQAYKEYINSVFANGKFSNQREVIRKLQEIRQQLASGNLFLN